jgi:superfamily II DNA helicase RecQ
MSLMLIVLWFSYISLEGYYQESGRAGRDGLAANCVLLYGKKDKAMIVQMLETPTEAAMKQVQAVVDYCEIREECRRVTVLRYLGENGASFPCLHGKCCDICDAKASGAPAASSNAQLDATDMIPVAWLGVCILTRCPIPMSVLRDRPRDDNIPTMGTGDKCKKSISRTVLADVLMGRKCSYMGDMLKAKLQRFGVFGDFKERKMTPEATDKLVDEMIRKGWITERPVQIQMPQFRGRAKHRRGGFQRTSVTAMKLEVNGDMPQLGNSRVMISVPAKSKPLKEPKEKVVKEKPVKEKKQGKEKEKKDKAEKGDKTQSTLLDKRVTPGKNPYAATTVVLDDYDDLFDDIDDFGSDDDEDDDSDEDAPAGNEDAMEALGIGLLRAARDRLAQSLHMTNTAVVDDVAIQSIWRNRVTTVAKLVDCERVGMRKAMAFGVELIKAVCEALGEPFDEIDVQRDIEELRQKTERDLSAGTAYSKRATVTVDSDTDDTELTFEKRRKVEYVGGVEIGSDDDEILRQAGDFFKKPAK